MSTRPAPTTKKHTAKSPEPTKRCSLCKKCKPLSQFSIERRAPDGHKHACKKCLSEKQREYDEKNRDVVRARARARREADPERHREYARQAYWRKPEEHRKWASEYQKRHRAERTAYLKAYLHRRADKNGGAVLVTEKRCPGCGKVKPASEFAKNRMGEGGLQGECKQCKNERERLYYQTHREQKAAYAREYQRKNAAKLKARATKWRQENKHKVQASVRRRRGRLQNADGNHTGEEFLALVAYYCPDGRCLCCGEVKPLSGDHVIPLTKGGSNSIANIQPLCVSCNASKSTKSTDYRPDKGKFARRLAKQ